MLGKAAINVVSVREIGITGGAGILSAIGLSQIGEFSFILGSTGLSAGILTQDVYQVFLAITIVTMEITPFAVNAGPAIAKKLVKPKLPGESIFGDDAGNGEIKHKEHVIIVGYGLAGQDVAKALKLVNIPYLILELNAETVNREKKRG